MTERLKAFEGDADVASLGVEAAIAQAQHAHVSLKTGLDQTVRKWAFGVTLQDKKDEFEHVIKNYQEKFKTLLDFRACLDKLENDARYKEKMAAKVVQRGVRYDRDKMKKFLSKGCPMLVQKMLSSRVDEKTKELATTCCYTAEFADGDNLQRPVMFLAPDFEHPSYLHQTLGLYTTINEKGLKEKFNKRVTSIRDNKGTFAVSVFEGTEAFTALDPAATDATTFSDIEHQVTLLHVQKVRALVLDFEGAPLMGAPGFITSVVGRLSVIVMPLQNFLDKDPQPSLASFLHSEQKSDINKTKKVPSFVIDVGESLWVPFGSVPLIVGMSGDCFGDDEFCAYIFHHVLATGDAQCDDATTKAWVASSMSTFLTKKFKPLQTSRDAISKWKGSLEA